MYVVHVRMCRYLICHINSAAIVCTCRGLFTLISVVFMFISNCPLSWGQYYVFTFILYTHMQVIVSNMLYNSSGVTGSAMTWPLAPEPLKKETSNTSFTVSVTLEEKHRDIVSLKIKVYPFIEFLIGNLSTNH